MKCHISLTNAKLELLEYVLKDDLHNSFNSYSYAQKVIIIGSDCIVDACAPVI